MRAVCFLFILLCRAQARFRDNQVPGGQDAIPRHSLIQRALSWDIASSKVASAASPSEPQSSPTTAETGSDNGTKEVCVDGDGDTCTWIQRFRGQLSRNPVRSAIVLAMLLVLKLLCCGSILALAFGKGKGTRAEEQKTAEQDSDEQEERSGFFAPRNPVPSDGSGLPA